MSSPSQSHSFTLATSTHSLSFILHAPHKGPSAPLVIVFTGSGDVSLSWIRVTSALATHFSVLTYDRSGLGASPRGPNPALASVAARELAEALSNTSSVPVPLPSPPYVLLAHSYGALVAREYLAAHDADVAAMVLVDPAQDEQHLWYDFALIGTMCKGLSLARVTEMREKSGFSDEEWRARVRAIGAGLPAAMDEVNFFAAHCEGIRAHRQIERQVLGERPLSVVMARSRMDYELMFKAGVEKGNGTEDEQVRMRKLLDEWDEITRMLMRKSVGISKNGRLLEVDCGHNVPVLRPNVVVEEVKWVMKELKKGTDLENVREKI